MKKILNILKTIKHCGFFKGIMDLFKQSLNELSYLEIDDIKHNYDQLYDLYYTVDGINQDIYDQFSQSYFSEERYNEVQDTFQIKQA